MNELVLPTLIIPSGSIVDLNDQDICAISYENLKDVSGDQLITNSLEDDDFNDDELLPELIPHDDNVPVLEQEVEEKLTLFEKSMLNYQRLIVEKVSGFSTLIAVDVRHFLVGLYE